MEGREGGNRLPELRRGRNARAALLALARRRLVELVHWLLLEYVERALFRRILLAMPRGGLRVMLLKLQWALLWRRQRLHLDLANFWRQRLQLLWRRGLQHLRRRGLQPLLKSPAALRRKD